MSERVWIIGASDGIGAALAEAYAARGAALILSARRADALAAVAETIGGAEIAPLDVTDRAALAQAAARGPVDRIIHLAALYDPSRIAEIDPDRAAKLVQVNLLGALNVAQLCPAALKPGGQLALCGSVAGYVGLPQGQLYSASKAAVINLAESLRAERSDLDVRLISPGFVDTRLTEKNDFDMPMMITPRQAAEAIVSGLDGGGFEVHFPKRFTLMVKLLRALPYWISLKLTRRMSREEGI